MAAEWRDGVVNWSRGWRRRDAEIGTGQRRVDQRRDKMRERRMLNSYSQQENIMLLTFNHKIFYMKQDFNQRRNFTNSIVKQNLDIDKPVITTKQIGE